MSDKQRIRRQQILREAEGYLDLITVFGDRWVPPAQVRDRLAERALATLEGLARFGGSRAHALYLTGHAYRAMGRYAAAIKPLQESAEIDADNIHVWLALGWCQKRCGRLDLAIQALEEALDVDRGEAIVHYNLACYWSLAGNARRSLTYLSRAFDIDPNYRDLVASERDFDPIRDHPDFQSLTSVIV